MRKLNLTEICIVAGGNADSKPGGGLGGALDKVGRAELTYEGAKFILTQFIPWLSSRIEAREMRVHLETLAERAQATLWVYNTPGPGPSGPDGGGVYLPPPGSILPPGIRVYDDAPPESFQYHINAVMDALDRDWQGSTQMER